MITRSLALTPALSLLLAAAALAQDANYEKYTLPNGMKVILHEDHALPVASINIWYGVGAQDEPPGRSGFAHLFEHLMFMGTARVPGNQFDVLMETGGGANNASTDLHRTNYFSWGPSKLLPTLLWLDADRLEDFGLNVTQEKLDKQRDVVRNELRQTVENAPYGKADEAIWRLMFPADHPYVTGVIGTHEDLEAANVNNVKDFFANFYVANNASLVVAGDFDPVATKKLIAELFGTIAPGPAISRKYTIPTEPVPVSVQGTKRLTSIDQVELPRIQYTFGGPIGFAKGDAELKLAAATLADGKSSRLYQRLVMEEGLAADVNASFQGYPLAGIFQINIFAKPDADLARIERIVDQQLSQFVQRGPTADELARHQVTFERRVLDSMQSIESKADAMNEYEAAWGEPNGFKRDIARFRDATTDGVKDWAARVLRADAKIVTRVLPESPERAKSPRDEAPAPARSGDFALPAPKSFTLANGLKVLVFERKDLPLVALRLSVKPGGGLDPLDKPGLASLAMEMLNEGAGPYSATQFSDELQKLGAEFATGATEETLSISMNVLARNWDKAAGLFAEALLHPKMDETDFARAKALRLDDLALMDARPTFLADRVANRILFGDKNPYATPSIGESAAVEELTLDELKAFHKAALSPKSALLLVAGDVTLESVQSTLTPLLNPWTADARATGLARGESMRTPTHTGLRLAIVDRPGATQTVVRFAMPGTVMQDPRRVQLGLVNIILGGSFTSRLNQNLRERNGFTYGARSSFNMWPSTGSFTAGASVAADTTGRALEEFFAELNRIRAGDISTAEAAKARETFRNDTVRDFSSLRGMLDAIGERLDAGLDFELFSRDLGMIGRVDEKELNETANAAIQMNHAVLVLVGDKATILEQIKGQRLPDPEFYSLDGEPVR